MHTKPTPKVDEQNIEVNTNYEIVQQRDKNIF